MAHDYCVNLMKDIKTTQKLTNGGRMINYLQLRHEDMMMNPFSVMMTLFNFLEVK